MIYRMSRNSPVQSPEWRVWSPQRVGDFRWSIIPENWFQTDPLTDTVCGALLIVEFVLIMPTVGLIRLAVHHRRSPGWYVECRYGTVADLPTDPRIRLQTRTKRQAKRLERALEREFRNGADFNSPAIQAVIARSNAAVQPVTPPVTKGTS